MRMDAALPIDRERGFALMWSVVDMVEPAKHATAPHSPAVLATTIFNGIGPRAAAVRDAIAAVEALDPGYALHADRARATLDAWIAALPFVEDHVPFPQPGGFDETQAWLEHQVNVELRPLIELATLAAPGPEALAGR